MRPLAIILIILLCAVSLESQISPGALHRLIGNPNSLGTAPNQPLLVHYNFAEQSPILYDQSGNGLHGSAVNCTWQVGPNGLGKSIWFNGTSSAAHSPVITYNTNVITVCGWIQVAYPAVAYGYIWGSACNIPATDNTFFYYPYDNGPTFSNQVAIQSGSISNGQYCQFAWPSPALSNWVHTAVVYDNSTTSGNIIIYTNGILVSATKVKDLKDQTGNFANYGINLFWDSITPRFTGGSLSDFRVYAGALSQSQVQYVKNNQSTNVSTYYGLTNNLASYWRLDEASGDAADSWGSNTLTNYSSATYTTGKITNCVSVNGTSYLEHSDNASLSIGWLQDFTLTFWTKMNTKAATQMILAKYAAGAATGEYVIYYYQPDDRFILTCSDRTNAPNIDFNSLGGPATNTWYFVQAWWTGGTLYCQANWTGTNSAALASGVQDYTNPFQVGRWNTAGQQFNGLVDEVGLWKRSLTEGERHYLYNSGNGKTFPFTP